MEVLAAEPSRLADLHAVSIDARARRRFTAFVGQARAFFTAIPDTEPAAKPLLAYYFALNLAKAFLNAKDPNLLTANRIPHGLRSGFNEKSKYYFEQEGFKVAKNGVFRLLAEATGMGHCWADDYRIGILEAMPYLPEAHDLYADSYGRRSKLVPAATTEVLWGDHEGSKAAWIRFEFDREVLRSLKLGPSALVSNAVIFGSRFRLVKDTTRPTASYEAIEVATYGQKRSEALPRLTELFEQMVPLIERNRMGGRTYVALSRRRALLSQEALTLGVLWHLSEMVRYRPAAIELLRGGRHFWVFSSWVDRACENLLLALATRITREEHILG